MIFAEMEYESEYGAIHDELLAHLRNGFGKSSMYCARNPSFASTFGLSSRLMKMHSTVSPSCPDREA